MANPPHAPTDEQRDKVKTYAGLGVPQVDIAKMIGICQHTLLVHYRDELDLGMAQANAKIAGTLFQQAMSGNTAATIFWLKARCGWREKHEIVGKNGGPIEVDSNVNYTGVPRPQDFQDPAVLKALLDALNASET